MKFKTHLSITKRLIICVIPIMILCIGTFGILALKHYKEDLSLQLQTELALFGQNISSITEQMLAAPLESLNRVAGSEGLKNWFEDIHTSGKAPGTLKTYNFYKQILIPLFSNDTSTTKYQTRIYVFDSTIHRNLAQIFPLEQFPDDLPLDYLTSIHSTKISIHLSKKAQPFNDGKFARRLCASRILFAQDGSPLAIINTEIKIDELENSIAEVVKLPNQIFCSLKLLDGTDVFQPADWDKVDWKTEKSVVGGQLTISLGYSRDYFDQRMTNQLYDLISIMICCALCGIISISLTSKLLLSRLQTVIANLLSYDGKHDLSPISGHDEAAKLQMAFVEILKTREKLTRQNEKLDHMNGIIKYQLVMAKINPHFLYNALSTVKWLILTKEPHEAAGIVDDLVKFYRGCLHRGSDFAVLSSEVELIECYINLHKRIYNRQVEFWKEGLDAIGNTAILKFLLQPIIENALKYSYTDECCIIKIKGHLRNECLTLTISNNGASIDKATADKLNSYNTIALKELPALSPAREDVVGYGVFNVITRLRMIYGDDASLTHTSLDNSGTEAQFVIPLLKK